MTFTEKKWVALFFPLLPWQNELPAASYWVSTVIPAPNQVRDKLQQNPETCLTGSPRNGVRGIRLNSFWIPAPNRSPGQAGVYPPGFVKGLSRTAGNLPAYVF